MPISKDEIHALYLQSTDTCDTRMDDFHVSLLQGPLGCYKYFKQTTLTDIEIDQEKSFVIYIYT
jgi:hypothetical protein